jgi:hypothetical protein
MLAIRDPSPKSACPCSAPTRSPSRPMIGLAGSLPECRLGVVSNPQAVPTTFFPVIKRSPHRRNSTQYTPEDQNRKLIPCTQFCFNGGTTQHLASTVNGDNILAMLKCLYLELVGNTWNPIASHDDVNNYMLVPQATML